ncbi:MAG: hypothetical protein GEU75_11835 [Dehalococcoidia bacterium]|nr:hypothetical protein [Dehalococcoidia bacterium]
MSHGRSKHEEVLTPRKWQVLDLIREGLTNEQIAEKLGISPNTAKFHVSEIISKLGVASRNEAVEVIRHHSYGQRLIAWFAVPLGRASLAVSGVAVIGLLALLIVTSPWSSGSSNQSAVIEGNDSVGLDLLPATAIVVPVGYADPFEYCAAVGTIDEPDAGYVGPMFSASLVEGFARAIGLAPDKMPGFVWRCAEGRVMACTHGNNLHCGKPDTNLVPTARMIEYCATNLRTCLRACRLISCVSYHAPSYPTGMRPSIHGSVVMGGPRRFRDPQWTRRALSNTSGTWSRALPRQPRLGGRRRFR